MSIFIAGTDCHPPKKMLALLSIMFKLAVIVTTAFLIATGCSTGLLIMTEPTVGPRHTIHFIFAAGGIFMDKSALQNFIFSLFIIFFIVILRAVHNLFVPVQVDSACC